MQTVGGIGFSAQGEAPQTVGGGYGRAWPFGANVGITNGKIVRLSNEGADNDTMLERIGCIDPDGHDSTSWQK